MAKPVRLALLIGGLSGIALGSGAVVSAAPVSVGVIEAPAATASSLIPEDGAGVREPLVTLAQATRPLEPVDMVPRETATPRPAAAPPARVVVRRRDIHVAAPTTDVRVAPDRGAVRVQAPYTRVYVNADRGRVAFRAPGVNLDIRW